LSWIAGLSFTEIVLTCVPPDGVLRREFSPLYDRALNSRRFHLIRKKGRAMSNPELEVLTPRNCQMIFTDCAPGNLQIALVVPPFGLEAPAIGGLPLALLLQAHQTCASLLLPCARSVDFARCVFEPAHRVAGMKRAQ